MSSGRRRRALILLVVALACGTLAATRVGAHEHAIDARVGAPVPILVTARAVSAGDDLTRADLAVRQVPVRFAPADALADPTDAVGVPAAGSLAKGSYVTRGVLGAGSAGDGSRAPSGLRRGERAVEVSVAGGAALEGAAPGSRVDVLVSTDPGQGSGRTLLALEGVELLDLQPGGDSAASGDGDAHDGAAATGSATATLRVSVRQAVYLTAAQNFARELRLLPRPPGDRARSGRDTVTASGL